MANTGHDWAAAGVFAKDAGGGDWDADAIADNGSITSNTSISLDIKSACAVGIKLVEDNTGAIDGVVTVFVLRNCCGLGDEDITNGSPWSFTITPVQNATVYKEFTIEGGSFKDFKIAIKNESGQELATSVKYLTADIPVAA